jgi:hypothetical protein
MASSTYPVPGAAKVAALIAAQSWWIQVGTGTTSAATAQTGLVAPSGAAVSGTHVQSTTTTTGDTVTFTGTLSVVGAITEVAVFDGSTGSGTDTMLQRHVFDTVNLGSGDAIEFTIKHQQLSAAS